ncbi:MAG: AtpZ/AtpI family protein [Planctomycetes bacterium]|nr:AtpZ/AtpI family protein [Planctomycetota bacterium]
MASSPSPGREPSPKRAPAQGELTREFTRYAGLGFQFVAALGVFGLLGGWLDSRLGTRPWLLVVGIFVGAALGFYSLLKAIPSGSRAPRSGPPDDEARTPPTR